MRSVITLNSGWNWISFNVINEDVDGMLINNYLNNLQEGSDGWSEGDYIKTQSTTSSYSHSSYNISEVIQTWTTVTGINEINTKTMYKIYVLNDIILEINGRECYREEATKQLLGDNVWNWISYPLSNKKLDMVFAENEDNIFSENDYLKSQTQYALYNNNNWKSYGNLDTLEKNKGYLMQINKVTSLEFLDLEEKAVTGRTLGCYIKNATVRAIPINDSLNEDKIITTTSS